VKATTEKARIKIESLFDRALANPHWFDGVD